MQALGSRCSHFASLRNQKTGTSRSARRQTARAALGTKQLTVCCCANCIHALPSDQVGSGSLGLLVLYRSVLVYVSATLCCSQIDIEKPLGLKLKECKTEAGGLTVTVCCHLLMMSTASHLLQPPGNTTACIHALICDLKLVTCPTPCTIC